jgi:uncharacterized protein YjiS (DUF1127 family)
MRLLRQLIERMEEQWDRQATIRELRQLSSRQLCDIGIEPYQIEDVVDGMLKSRREQAERSAHASPVGGRGAVRGSALPARVSERCC